MSQAHPVFYDYGHYVRLETESDVKHEYLDGNIYAMAGGTVEHAGIAMNIGAILSNQLEGKRCRVYSSDVRVRVPATTLTTYPDVTVVCGKAELDGEDPNGGTLLNPIVLVEVLSKSTEKYDRTEKFDHYRRIPSLREVLLVSHREKRVEVRRRPEPSGRAGSPTEEAWTVHEAREGEVAELLSIGCKLPVAAMYRDGLSVQSA